jgi:hypothetical protein
MVLLLCGAGCSSSDPTGGAPDGPRGLDCTSGACLTPAQLLVTNQGGTALSRMEVWTVVWNGDEAVGDSVNTFNDAFLTSAYWTETLGEYGVGAGVAKGVIRLGVAPPPTVVDQSFDDVIQSLGGMTATNGAVFDAPNDQTVIGFVLPKSTRESVGTSYHIETSSQVISSAGNAIYVPYIVLEQIHVGFVSDFAYLTWSQSHELGETATDPLPDFDPGWYNLDVFVEGEIADLCNNIPAKESLGGTIYTLNRFYSGKLAAARTGDPCLPGFDTQFVDIALMPLNLHIPSGVGQTGLVRLAAYSYGPNEVYNWQLLGDASYSLSPDHGTIQPGQTIGVQVKRISVSPPDPTALNVWLTTSGNAGSPIPSAESYGAITVGH